MTHRIPAAARNIYDQLDLSLRIRVTGQDAACSDVSVRHADAAGFAGPVARPVGLGPFLTSSDDIADSHEFRLFGKQ
jgi:hypothetical protein